MGAIARIPRTRNVIVCGASYAGARAAELLSRTLPPTHRVVVIDRQSHFNHLYLHPRVGVVPGHTEKVFIPYSGVLPADSAPPSVSPATSPAAPSRPRPRHVVVHASIVSLTDDYVELDRDLLEHERDIEGDENEVEKLTEELEESRLEERQAKVPTGRRLSWDYLVYALGCTLPPPLVSLARTKKTGIAFLEAQQSLIASSSSILIAGGGALGLQYATDICDLYNNPANEHHLPESCRPAKKKRVTLVHSRDRFLPLYKQEVHDEVMRRLEELGVDVVLGERLQLPSGEDDEPGVMKKVKTSSGKEIEYDLLLRCTGQKPNSQLMREFLPEALDDYGYINVRPTLQIDLSQVPSERLNEKIQRNVYAIGDVAAAGVIKAGHTGWNQAGVVTQNIMCCVETDLLNAACDESAECGKCEAELVDYEKSVPQIKVTLGLHHSVSELLPSMDAKDTVVTKADNGQIDGHYAVVWNRMGVDASDTSI
ncbi:hypothetical protein JCM1841_001101 [Sporobolomyces salmonicolor]